MVHVGIGYDVHQLVEGRKCILGGVDIPHDKGLDGHSDADVLMHAVCDAVLGAIGKPDIVFQLPKEVTVQKDGVVPYLYFEVPTNFEEDVWVQADFTENNLGNIKRGDSVEIVFDSLPGKVIEGTVRTTGFGVAVDSAPLGSLPTIDNDRQWLRDAQRFPVLVDITEMPAGEARRRLKIGSQASVITYTGGHPILALLGKLYIRAASILTYAY